MQLILSPASSKVLTIFCLEFCLLRSDKLSSHLDSDYFVLVENKAYYSTASEDLDVSKFVALLRVGKCFFIQTIPLLKTSLIAFDIPILVYIVCVLFILIQEVLGWIKIYVQIIILFMGIYTIQSQLSLKWVLSSFFCTKFNQ